MPPKIVIPTMDAVLNDPNRPRVDVNEARPEYWRKHRQAQQQPHRPRKRHSEVAKLVGCSQQIPLRKFPQEIPFVPDEKEIPVLVRHNNRWYATEHSEPISAMPKFQTFLKTAVGRIGRKAALPTDLHPCAKRYGLGAHLVWTLSPEALVELSS